MKKFNQKEYAGRLVASNTSDTGFAIVKATEVGGHRSVKNLSDLYALSTPILAISGDNSAEHADGVNWEDAIGQLWYVASEGKHYQLIDWANRKNANGWKVFKSGGGGGTLKFRGFISEEIANIGGTCAAPTDIFFYTIEGLFIAKDANGYYYDWQGTDLIPSSEEYGTYESGIDPHSDRTYINSANGQLYLYDPNQSMILTRATRPRVAYGTCSTAANVAEKVITLHSDFADWKLEVGAEFVVKSTYTNRASNVTLNVNNTGAKQIMYRGALYTSASNILTTANQLIRYVFDGTYYVWMGRSNENSYNPQSLGFGYGTCTTAADTAAKVATLTDYALIKNGIVSVKFTNSVPANSTLNINSKGAKPIFYRGSKIVAGVINAGDVATFIYDGTNYIYLGTDNALSRSGGKINGDLVIADDTDDVVEIDAQGITLRDTSDDTQPQTKITHAQVESHVIKKVGGTSDQVLMADGSVAGTITTAWLEANLT